jgi:hypothetical protein
MPTSFFIKAKDKNGNAVAMVVGPDSFMEVTDVMKKSSDVSAQQSPSTTAPAQPQPQSQTQK